MTAEIDHADPHWTGCTDECPADCEADHQGEL